MMKCAIPICASGIMFAKYLRHYFGTGVVSPSSSQIFCIIILFESVSVPLHRSITAGHEQGGGSTWGAVCAASIDDEVVAAKSKTVGSRTEQKFTKKRYIKANIKFKGMIAAATQYARGRRIPNLSGSSVLFLYYAIQNPRTRKLGNRKYFKPIRNFQNFEAKLVSKTGFLLFSKLFPR
jgi:Ni/Co efflux regulator RcnB